MKLKQWLMAVLALTLSGGCSATRKGTTESEPGKFYRFKATNMRGEEIPMETYKGQVVLVVNTASKCGLTPQFEGLEALYKTYKEEGLVILGFPSNEFGKQDPGTNDEILSFCQVNYGVTFPMFEKTTVNGNTAHPLFQFLKKALPGTPGNEIKWNFTKFLIDRAGRPVKRFAPTTKPADLEKEIRALLRTQTDEQ